MAKPLNERIQAAIKAGQSQGVESLIFEAEAASKQAVADHDAARERALDPLLSDDEIAKARRAMEDALFVQERMKAATSMLNAKLVEFRLAEDQGQRREFYETTMKRRDEMAERLRREYVQVANQLGALLEELAAIDADVLQANTRIPSDLPRLDLVEHICRPGPAPHSMPAYLTSVVIPAWDQKRVPIWGPGLSIFDNRPQFNRDTEEADVTVSANETPNAGEVHLTPEPRPGPARSPDALASPVGHSKQGEAA